jgi:hypothetical protein
MMEPPWTGLIVALLYGVQFETNLLNGVDRTTWSVAVPSVQDVRNTSMP